MKYLLIALISSCSVYQGVVVEKYCCPSTLLVEVGHNHFVVPKFSLNQFDSLDLGDSVKINPETLKIIK